MRRHVAIWAALAALALPTLAGAGEKMGSFDRIARSPQEGWVEASELTSLLVQNGLITREEQKKLAQPHWALSLDERALEEIFQTEPYRSEWRRGTDGAVPVPLRPCLGRGCWTIPGCRGNFVVRRWIDEAGAFLTTQASPVGAIARSVGVRTPSHFAVSEATPEPSEPRAKSKRRAAWCRV